MNYHVGARILSLSAVFSLLAAPAVAEIFKGMPDIIVCEIGLQDKSRTGHVLFYLDRQHDGGVTTYTSLGAAPIQIRVSADGRVERNNQGGCTGKTIAELREEDRAFDLE